MDETEIYDDIITRESHPKEKSTILGNILFCWSIPLFWQGMRKDFTEEDLFSPMDIHESKQLGDKLERIWSEEVKCQTRPSLGKSLMRAFGKEVTLYGFVFIVLELCVKLSLPFLIGKLISYYKPHQDDVSRYDAFLYASGIVLASLLRVLIVHLYTLALQHLGLRIQVACCSLIYRKILKLNRNALTETTIGQMVNLLSNDVSRFNESILHIHYIWMAPLQTLIIMYFLYTDAGPSGLVGIAILVAIIPFQFYLAKLLAVFRLKIALKTDSRIRLMNEIISSIKVIKMYAWEVPFSKLIKQIRKLELNQIRSSFYIRVVNLSPVMFLMRVAIFTCVLTHVFKGHQLTAEYVFVLTSFYQILRESLTIFFRTAIGVLAECTVSTRRIREFLLLEEVNPTASLQEKSRLKNIGIEVRGASMKLSKKSKISTLRNVNFEAKTGEIVAIIGCVGGGKSTLLHLILKEHSLAEGTLKVEGRISYAPQEPWLFPGSIRQNILFGSTMDQNRYHEVVKVCALERDFSLFPYGDRTIVGERGVMLSGGQKARISLARAVYKDADIYLLDDPLSAVDTHVGKQLFNQCISTFLKTKCVVLITHQLQYLKAVDKIYLLEDGEVTISGTYQELQKNRNDFLSFLKSDDYNIKSKNPNLKSPESKSIIKKASPIAIKEQRSTGTVSRRVYHKYISAGGGWVISSFLLLSFVLTQIGRSSADSFLTFWVNLQQDHAHQNATLVIGEEADVGFMTQDHCIYIYTALIVFTVAAAIIRSLSFYKYCLTASKNLHNNMFSAIICTTMRFFNTNPSGRILNRFSKDMGSIDESLPSTIIDTIQIGLNAFAITIVVSTVNHWMLIPTVIIFVIFYILRRIFLATSRNVKRIEATTRSPVFTHLAASLQGLTTIRAFGAQAILSREFDNHQNLHSAAFYLFLSCNKAFGFWLDLNCVIYIALTTLGFFFLDSEETYGGNVGLAITQAITLAGLLQWGMRQWSELENQMTSVERVVEYTEIAPEPDTTKEAPKWWPCVGTIAFKDVSLKYSTTDPPVLKNLNFNIQHKEKIGVVGRTGAGKSSLISALFRLADFEGTIVIDGINTKEITLNNLRSKISIIPQEPMLYSGSLRKNLDPFDEFNDNDVWNALEVVELKEEINRISLFHYVSEGGSNFSVGQRQLLCLARAILHSNRILILDEATANIDPQTDQLIQKTIRKKFRDCTVLTIAHRLQTVMDCDRILVIDAGEVVEFDHPFILLQNQDGFLYDLVEQTGSSMMDFLKTKAQESYKELPEGFK